MTDYDLLDAFVDFDMGGITPAEALVWVVLYRDTDPLTNTARVSCERIAARVGRSVRQVKRLLKKLADRGLIRVERRGGLNRGATTYRVLAGAG